MRGRLDHSYPAPGDSRAEVVMAPPLHEGVGNALRCAYVPPRDAEMPGEIERLVDKLR